jgi:predicted Zn-dependent peptidase
LFEHLMFRGSEHVADGQHYALVDAAGGEANANTTEDRTAFSETLPSNQLALGLWLEADRMRSLKITEQTLASQREQIKQERQVRVDNQPYGAAFLDGLTSAFDSTACFAYAHSVMGSLEDLDAAQTPEVEAFFKLHYVPNRATLTVVGDFEPGEARRLTQTYFGDIPRGAPVPEVSCAASYVAGERIRQWADALASFPAVIVTYRVPPHSDPDSRALQLVAPILGQGDGSRLNEELVRGERVAVQTASGIESRAGPGLLYAYAILGAGMNPDSVRRSLLTQVGRLGRDLTVAELEKAKTRYRAAATFGRQTTSQMAEEVQHFARFHGTPEEINTESARVAAITLDEARRVAAKYLVPQNSSTLIVLPANTSSAAGEHQHEDDE